MYSDKAELFKVLFAIYDITKANPLQPVFIPNILSYLGYDDSKENDILNLTLFLINEWLIKYEYIGPGIVITNQGIKEIEEAVIHHNAPTLHYPVNIVKNVKVEDSLIEFIHNVRKSRRDFLQNLYTTTSGQPTQAVYISEFAKELGLDEFMLNRVYWFLSKEGLIQDPFIGATSISHQGIIELQREQDNTSYSSSSFWTSTYPDITLVDELIEKIEALNQIVEQKMGIVIFNTRAKLFMDLRKGLSKLSTDIRDEHAFVVVLLSVGSILNDIKTGDIIKHINQEPHEGSINLIQQFFDSNNLSYDTKSLSTLRLVYKLRSTKTPIHSGESDFVKNAQKLGIEYPITDWAKASEIYLKVLVESLQDLITSI